MIPPPPPETKAPAPASTGNGGGTQASHQHPAAPADPAQAEKPIDLAALGDDEPVPDYYHAGSETFLVRNAAGRWQPFKSASYKRILTARGLSAAKKGEPLAEIDLEMIRVQTENDVSMFGPICGRNGGFFEENGHRVLVTKDMELIEPRRGGASTIAHVLKGLLHDSEDPDVGAAQLNAFVGWLQTSVRALRAGRYQQQQALAIAGVADCGKSLLQHLIITPCLAGRSVDAERYFLRQADFNSDLFEAEHLVLDDCQASTAIKDRLAFGARLKGCTVGNSAKSWHAKGRDAVTLKPWWRVSITCNSNPESLTVLPPLNEDFADKLILLRASRFDFRHPMESSDEKAAFARKLHAEMPAFLWWLLNEFELPEEQADPRRYGVATYHHPALKEQLESLSPESELLELLDLVLGDELLLGPHWSTAERLEERIRATSHHRRAERLFTHGQACGKYLQRLSTKRPDRVSKSRTATQNGWLIHPRPDFVEGVEGVEGE